MEPIACRTSAFTLCPPSLCDRRETAPFLKRRYLTQQLDLGYVVLVAGALADALVGLGIRAGGHRACGERVELRVHLAPGPV